MPNNEFVAYSLLKNPATITNLIVTNYEIEISSAKAKVFGELLKLAKDTVEAYHCDFFHDATWIDKWLTGDIITFYYGYDENGTALGTDQHYVGYSRKNVFKIVVWVIDGVIKMSIERI